MNSPWFKLFLYHLIGAGPSSISFSKGHRVKSIPEVFQRCDTVLLCTWNKEPSIIHLNNLLPILNEHLLDAPVLVQEYGQIGSDVDCIDVPFPFDSVPEGEQTESNFKTKIISFYPIEMFQFLLKTFFFSSIK